MFRAIQGGSVLVLLSLFFSYLLAPVVGRVSRRVRIGRRGRPLSRAGALLILYGLLFIPAGIAWHLSGDRITEWGRRGTPRAIASRVSHAPMNRSNAR